jgi:hypothetical protein
LVINRDDVLLMVSGDHALLTVKKNWGIDDG